MNAMTTEIKFRQGTQLRKIRRRIRLVEVDPWQGALAGFVGGVAGAAAKRLAEKMLSRNTRSQAKKPDSAGPWIVGPLAGAVYGAVVEYEPELTARHGAAFGLGLNSLGRESVIPLLAGSTLGNQKPKQHRWSEAASAVVFGVVTETVRRIIRGR